MKLKARIFSSIVAMIMLMTAMVIPTGASSNPTLSLVASAETVVPGGEVTLVVNMQNNPGIVSMRLELDYDSDVFSIASIDDVVDAGILGSSVHNNNPGRCPYILSWQNGAAEEDYTVNGNLVSIKFAVSDEAVIDETYNFSLSYDYDNTDIMNCDLESVYFDTVDAEVTVVKADEPPVQPDTDTVLSIGTVSGKAGETVTVDVSLEENPGLAVLACKVNYDSSVLTLNSITNGTLFPAVDGNTANVPVTLNAYNASNITSDGVFATLSFTIAADAEEGDYDLTLSIIEAYDQNAEDIPVKVENGIVTVKNFIYGDVNGDSIVNRKDLLMLAQHFADFDVAMDEQASDVNVDGIVNRKDLLMLAQYFADFDVTLGKSK